MEQGKSEIVVTGESVLQDVQEAFSRFYPFLKMEIAHDRCVGSGHANLEHATGRSIKMPVSVQASFTIDVSRQRIVTDLVNDIFSRFCVKVQICRKSGNVWNAVSLTENWTLERQNDAGEYISRIMEAPSGE